MIAIDVTARAPYMLRAQPMPKKVDDDVARVTVGVRLTQRDAERLTALQEEIGIATRHAIPREALRIGLDALEEDSTRRARSTEASAPKRADARKPKRRHGA
jgi:hypothetical protein